MRMRREEEEEDEENEEDEKEEEEEEEEEEDGKGLLEMSPLHGTQSDDLRRGKGRCGYDLLQEV